MGNTNCAVCGQWSGKGHRCPPGATQVARPNPYDRSVPAIDPSTGNPYKQSTAERTAAAAAAIAAMNEAPVKTAAPEPQITKADVDYRMWERDQAERMGLDPDTYAGPILFTDEEYAEMYATHESRVMYGYELECGCRPGTCSYEYGGDCKNAPTEDDYINEASGPTGPYTSRQEMDESFKLVKSNFQQAQETLALSGFEASAAASPGLQVMRKGLPIDFAGGPKAVVAQMEEMERGADMVLNSEIGHSVAWDFMIASSTAAKVANRIRDTYPDQFPKPLPEPSAVDDPFAVDPPF